MRSTASALASTNLTSQLIVEAGIIVTAVVAGVQFANRYAGKQDMKRCGDLETKLRDSYAVLQDEFAAVEKAVEEFNAKIDAHNEIINEASGFRDNIVSEIDASVADRSEKWNDGDAGAAYGEWKSEWENLVLDEIERLDAPTMPDGDHADELEKAPTEPN